VNFANGMLNLTSWLGNVIMPTVAGLFAAAAIFNFTKGRNYQHLAYASLASLMCSGLPSSTNSQAAAKMASSPWESIGLMSRKPSSRISGTALFGTMPKESSCVNASSVSPSSTAKANRFLCVTSGSNM